MTNCAKNLTRLIAMLIMVCTIVVATVSCDKLPFDFEGIFGGQQNAGGEDTPPDNEQPDEEQPDECTHESKTEGKCDNCGEIFTITIAEAIEIAAANPAGTAERYYIRATVKTISNPSYGEMTIEDETGEIYVYGTYSFDGALSFPQIDSTPVKGDEVLLHCTLGVHNETAEVKNAHLIEFVHNEIPFDESQYTKATIAEARNADTGAKVIISGTVAQITYSDGNPYVPSGVILVDDTSSIYVYGVDVAGQVKVGNTVTVAGDKAYWILGDEVNNAQKFGYTGSCQLENATVISKDADVKEFDKSWIAETTVKEIIDTPFSENITNKIFKVNALVKKAPGNGYTNYYINDIDGTTGSYTYTQCNGNDFGWLDQFDGKICTVYMVVQNAKSTGTGCVWRLLPIEVIDEGYEFDVTKAAEYAVKYHGIGQFLDRYTGDPAITLNSKVDSVLLGFEGATLSYTSSNEAVVYFTEEDGVVTFHCGEAGKATVTVSATHGENTYSEDIEIVVIPNIDVDYVEVKDAIAAEVDSTVTVKGKSYKFINGIGYGIDGYCCEVGDKMREAGDKKIDYTMIAIKGLLFHFKPADATITVDGKEYFYKKVWIAPTMHGRCYGGGMIPTPKQDRLNAEGSVSVMAFHGTSKLKTLMIFPSLFKGEHIKHTEAIAIHEGKEITVKFSHPASLQIDGETILDVSEYTVHAGVLAKV